MLNVQRERYMVRKAEIQFSRVLLWVHLALGWIPAALLVFHEMFFWSAAFFLWFLSTLGLVAGFPTAKDWCRIALGILCLTFTLLGLVVLVVIYPTLPEADAPLLSRRPLPLWLGFFNLGYFVLGMTLMINSRVRKAVAIGFTLW